MEKKINKQTNSAIDFFKAIACIGVVLIHCKFPGTIGTSLRTLARFAVPFFTMISGFYLINREGRVDIATIHRKIKHTLKLILGAEMFALVLFVITAFITEHSLNAVVMRYTDIAKIIKLVWDGTPLSYIHFWYLYALLLCYITVLFFKKIKFNVGGKWIIILALVLFGIFYGMSVISNLDLLIDFKFSIVRDDNISALYNLFIFRTAPFFMLGVAMRIYEQKIIECQLLSKGLLLICILTGALISIVERLVLGDVQIFIGTCLVVLSAYIYCIKYPVSINEKFEKIGKNLSLYVYIIHVSVIEVINWIGKILEINEYAIFKWLCPIIVIIFSLLCAKLVYEISIAGKKKMSVQR